MADKKELNAEEMAKVAGGVESTSMSDEKYNELVKNAARDNNQVGGVSKSSSSSRSGEKSSDSDDDI